MPTYRNTTQSIVCADNYVFNPGESKEILRYLDLTLHPELVKTSDAPPISRIFNLCLDDVTVASRMSSLYSFFSGLLVYIKDGTVDPNNADTVDVQVYGSYSDLSADLVPLDLPIRFTRTTVVDAAGTTNSYWLVTNTAGYRTNNIVNNINRDPFVFYAVSVPSISISAGSVDIYVKNLR